MYPSLGLAPSMGDSFLKPFKSTKHSIFVDKHRFLIYFVYFLSITGSYQASDETHGTYSSKECKWKNIRDTQDYGINQSLLI